MVHELQSRKNIQKAKQFVTEADLEPKVVQFFVGGNDVGNKSVEHVKEEVVDLMATTRSTLPQGTSIIVFSKISPREEHGRFNNKVAEINNCIKYLAQNRHSDIHYMAQMNLSDLRHRPVW